jgi:hypothetical protein
MFKSLYQGLHSEKEHKSILSPPGLLRSTQFQPVRRSVKASRLLRLSQAASGNYVVCNCPAGRRLANIELYDSARISFHKPGIEAIVALRRVENHSFRSDTFCPREIVRANALCWSNPHTSIALGHQLAGKATRDPLRTDGDLTLPAN